MNGQLKISEKNKMANAFIRKVNPYESCSKTDFRFDFRGYSNYLRENKLDSRKLPEGVAEQFIR